MADPRLGGTWTHADIVDHAFPGLSASQRDIIKAGSAKVDRDQSRAGAYMHGMTPYGGDRDQAIRDSNSYVKDSEDKARATQNRYADAGGEGVSNKALKAFSPAFHERTDETSPPHQGHQEWRGLGEGNVIEQVKELAEATNHAAREATATDQEKAASIKAAQDAYRETFGDAVAKKATTPPADQQRPDKRE